MVKVSIIMPIYNASQFLECSCQSVSKQTLKDIELICVDDGSTDESLETLHKLKEKYNFIKIFSQTNQGAGKARNLGISKAVGEYIAFLDADDKFIDENALEKMYIYGFKNNADIICGNLKRIKQNGEIEENYDFKNARFTYFPKKDIVLPIEYGIPFAFYKNIYKRSFILENSIEFPDLLYGEDPLFLTKALTNVDEIYVLGTDLYGYNHSIGGGVNMKIDTLDKKHNYIQHFKCAFDMLKDNLFMSSYLTYKREFVDYLLFQDNLFDEEIKICIKDIFPDFEKYFDENDYGFEYIDMIVNSKEDLVNKYKDFRDIKKYLIEETMIDDNFINVDYLRKYVSICEQDDSCMINQVSITAIKDVERYVNNDQRELQEDLELVKKEINDKIYINNAIFSSTSWKITKPLRKIVEYFR